MSKSEADKSIIPLNSRSKGLDIDLSSTRTFEFDGNKIKGYKGDTIASALYGAGVRIFSRSFKYHRPRGLLCVEGNCPNCLVTVDGVPNVRCCQKSIREGMIVKSQNAWPSLSIDFMSITNKFGWLMPVGFYYKFFHTPKSFWSIAAKIIRKVAGLGSISTTSDGVTNYESRDMHSDVVVVGGGPSGMSAAIEAAKHGCDVTLVDKHSELGGHLRWSRPYGIKISGQETLSSITELNSSLVSEIISNKSITLLNDSSVFGAYEDNLLGIRKNESFIKLRSKSLVIATGAHEIPPAFVNNDLPGVMLCSAVDKLIRLYGLKPGGKAVVFGSSDLIYQTALDMVDAYIEVVAIVDERKELDDLDLLAQTNKHRIQTYLGYTIVKSKGGNHIEGCVISPISTGRDSIDVSCDILAVSDGMQTNFGLLQQSGFNVEFDPEMNQFLPKNEVESVFYAGRVSGELNLEFDLLSGKKAGLQAAYYAGFYSGDLVGEIKNIDDSITDGIKNSKKLTTKDNRVQSSGKTFICYCEDVLAGDVKKAIDEGYTDIQTLKRYTTVTMGPCQGEMCQNSFARICGSTSNLDFEGGGLTTRRPPLSPIPIASLARPESIVQHLTSIDRLHRKNGGQMVDIGGWQRPLDYGSPSTEALTVRNKVGVIDVSTLGKLDVQGDGAGELLDRLYTHRFSNLKIGKIRYGILCADNGTIMDDGTVTKLDDNHYFVTTSTAGVESIEQWFKWWLVGMNKKVHIVNVTSSYAAINIAGPFARDVLSKLTDTDLNTEQFPYMNFKNAEVAGVKSRLLRVGFVGELGWEIHFPSEYGEYMWKRLIEAGKEFGINPFGVEAQRILRLEKQHIIPNQDTDILSNPLNIGASWAVKFDKEDFIGKQALAFEKSKGFKNLLAGFVMEADVIPDDGDPVIIDGQPLGKVTSSRLSPVIGKGFGLVWVPNQFAVENSVINIRVGNVDYPARIVMSPIYDPTGERLKI